MTPMKLKTMGDVLEGLLVVRGSPTVTDTLGDGVIVTGSVSVESVDEITPSRLLRVVEFISVSIKLHSLSNFHSVSSHTYTLLICTHKIATVFITGHITIIYYYLRLKVLKYELCHQEI